jgi:hypothetical protein
MDEDPLKLARLLLPRLERISADSVWAHRASGVRGALLHEVDDIDSPDLPNQPRVEQLIELALAILNQAAKEKHLGLTR